MILLGWYRRPDDGAALVSEAWLCSLAVVRGLVMVLGIYQRIGDASGLVSAVW